MLIKRYFERSLDALESEAVAIGKETGCPCAAIQGHDIILRSKVLPDRIIVTRNEYGNCPETKTYKLRFKKVKLPKFEKVVVQDSPPPV